MNLVLKYSAYLLLFWAIPIHVYAEPAKNRIWFTWEHQSVNSNLCQDKDLCHPVSRYLTRLVEITDTPKAEQMTGAVDRLASVRNQPVDHPDAPTWCAMTDAAKILGFDAEHWPMAEKLAGLKGLQGVYFELGKLKGPAGYDGPFGTQVHQSVVQKFKDAGIPVLTKDEMEQTPGKPHLNIYFSNTNPDTGCWFSVFASLSQTMLLTRNHTIKVKAGSWGFSGGYSADHPTRAEFDAIMLVADRFIEDFKKANPSGVKLVKN